MNFKLKALTGILVVSLIVAAPVFSNGEQEGSGESADGEQPDVTMIYHDLGLEFGQLIEQGAKDAAKEFGVDLNFTGPIGVDVEKQVNQVEAAITNNVDALAVSNVSAEALNPVIDRAVDKGIVTVTFNSDAGGSKREAFFGQDLVAAGEVQGETIVEHMGEEGKVLIISSNAAASWSQAREKGVRNALKEFSNAEVAGVVDAGSEEQQQYASIENALLGYEDIDAIATLGAPTTSATGTAIVRNNVKGLVHVGHDLLPETLKNIEKGATTASLSQDPYHQGYLTIKALYQYLEEAAPLESQDTGIKVVDDENVDTFLKKLEEGEPVG